MFMGKLFVVVIALLGLAGCSQEEPPSKAEAPRTELAYASTKDIRNINPHLYSGEMAAQNMVFEPLVVNTKASNLGSRKDGKSPRMGRNTPFISGKMLPSRMERLSTPRPSKRIWTPS